MTSNTTYPSRLIPKTSSTLIHPLDVKHILCRRVFNNVDLKLGTRLNPDAVYFENGTAVNIYDQFDQVFKFSTSKIPSSEIIDLFIKFKDDEIKYKYAANWDFKSIIEVPKNDDFIFETPDKYFFFKIGDINSFQIDIDVHPPHVHNFLLNAIHEPTCGNYWHCILFGNFKNTNINELSNNQIKRLKKAIAADIKSELVRISKFSLSDFD